MVESVADWGAGLDVLVNNAGIVWPRRSDMLATTPEAFDRVMGINLRGTFFLSQCVAKWMVAQPRSDGFRRSIVSIGSVSAEMATPERSEYCISKAGLAMLTKLLALRLAEDGISVFEVRPGIIRTDMTASVKDKYDHAIAGGLSPIRRWGEPVDVARATAALGAPRLRLRHRQRRPRRRRPFHPAALDSCSELRLRHRGRRPGGLLSRGAAFPRDPDVSVLLLEAGGSDRHPYIRAPAGFAKLTGTSHTWGYSTAPQREIDGRAMWYPQGRVLGGGSSINAMIYARGNAKDYDAWAEAGCAGWAYADVLPYFKRPEDNERFHKRLPRLGRTARR